MSVGDADAVANVVGIVVVVAGFSFTSPAAEAGAGCEAPTATAVANNALSATPARAAPILLRYLMNTTSLHRRNLAAGCDGAGNQLQPGPIPPLSPGLAVGSPDAPPTGGGENELPPRLVALGPEAPGAGVAGAAGTEVGASGVVAGGMISVAVDVDVDVEVDVDVLVEVGLLPRSLPQPATAAAVRTPSTGMTMAFTTPTYPCATAVNPGT